MRWTTAHLFGIILGIVLAEMYRASKSKHGG